MPDSYLHLPSTEQSKILRALGPELSRTPATLEKDVWVCWVLQTLFTMPGHLQMAFKGGTSLSKVFRAIARFSEDVDITLDYRGMGSSFNPFGEEVSRSQLKKLSDALKTFVSSHVHEVAAPYFRGQLAIEFGTDRCQVEVSEDGEQMRIHYPTVLDSRPDYVGNSVLVEFGGRNITEPNEDHEIRPDISEHITELDFPTSRVTVLSPARTFWEKATLMHVECQRGKFRANADRLSRHWYDLAMLADHEIGRVALANRDLLADVVKHKKVFYNTSYANYDTCLSGHLRLLPDDAGLSLLRSDFEQMIRAGMFIGEPFAFKNITERLRTLEADINN
ncbi:MAG: nucleotidyl transferase AbiEii/AbiGii toxin family protein [Ilumatobacteraceae bacterium]